MNTIHDENKIKSILINLTDITGFDHTSEALEAFHKAESLVKEYAEYIREKTIDECIACVPDENKTGLLELHFNGNTNKISVTEKDIETISDHFKCIGTNTCREKTITNLTKLKSNEKTN